MNLSIPFRKFPGYPADLYVDLEIAGTEDPKNVPVSAVRQDDHWVLHFGVFYAAGDLDFAVSHAKRSVQNRPLWKARVRKIGSARIIQEVSGE